MSSNYGYPPNQAPSSYEQAIANTYNNGNGFTPIATNTRGSELFQNNGKKGKPDYGNGGPAAGRSCLVVPFGSGKKKKKKMQKTKTPSPTRTPKDRNGLFSGRNPSSAESVSTTATSVADPYQVYYNGNDKQSLLKSFNKKHGNDNNDARDWYLETMEEEDETNDQDSRQMNGNMGRRPLQFGEQQQGQQLPYQQFTPTQRNYFGNPSPSNDLFPDLLKLPEAQDRSHEARGRQNRMHAYQGELEPEGVRGQEAKVVATSNSERSNASSRDQPAMRDFTNSNESGNSSKLLPIHQVVSDRQRQLRDSMGTSPQTKQEIRPNYRTPNRQKSPSTQNKYSPGYAERMKVASNVLEGGNLPPRQQSDFNGYEEDLEHEEISNHNRAEFQKEYEQESQTKQAKQRFDLQKQQIQLKKLNDNEKKPFSPSENDSVTTEDLRSFLTPSRKSAPVSVDDASFEKPLKHIQGIHAMAMEHVAKGEFDMALQAFEEVLKVYIQEHGEAHPLTASAHHNLGTVHTKRAGLLPEHTLHQRHCREQALQCFQAAARSARDCPTLGPNHPNVAVSLVRIGFLLLQARQYKNAVITFEEALRIRKENYGLYHGLVANLFNNLGVCHMHLQQFEEVRTHLQQALDVQKELLGKGSEDSSTALLELADTLCNIGGLNLEWIRRQGPDARRAMDAEAAFVEAQKLRARVLGEDHALTNQVRSLHDMVRSLPMPSAVAEKTTEKSTPQQQQTPTRAPPSWTSAPSSVSSGKLKNTFGGQFSPAGISDMTSSVGAPKNDAPKNSFHDRSMAETLAESAAMNNAGPLNIPALKPNRGAFQPTKQKNNAMDLYDATEESALLRKPKDNGETSSQVGGFATYARSTTSTGSGSNHESDRAATMRQAKDVLDSNRDFMGSPYRRTASEDTERTVDDRDGNAYEDGLVPLAGDWPGPKDKNRLSPICLQNPTQNLHTIHNCAVSYMARGRHTEAVALLEMVVECQKQKNGNLHTDVGSAVHNVGIAYLGGEVYYKAFQAFEEAVRIRKASLGVNHPVVAVSLVKFGISLMLLQRHEDSLWIFRDALAIRKEALGDLHPSNARIYNNIGCVHVELEELEEASKNFESALAIQRNALTQNAENGPMIFGASTTLQNLGYLYGKRGMFEKSAMVLRESLSVSQKNWFCQLSHDCLYRITHRSISISFFNNFTASRTHHAIGSSNCTDNTRKFSRNLFGC